MSEVTKIIRKAAEYAFAAVKWLPVAVVVGVAGGLIGVFFHHAIQWVTAYRLAHSWVIDLLPVGAVIIAAIYALLRIPQDMGTNLILEAVRSEKQVPLLLAPAIMLGTILTHFFGGSAGREGAALQIGGSIASDIAKLLRIHEESDRHLLILCGMAAVFSALFGTPITAAIFVLEVVSVGKFYYFALLPCLTAALTAFELSALLGGEQVRLTIPFTGEITVLLVFQVALLAVLCALMSIIFCVVVHRGGHFFGKLPYAPWGKALLGGTLLLALTLLAGGQTYNGAGFGVVEQAVAGEPIVWYAFLAKLLFTTITLAAGYKGGEIVPTFFVGATFGAVIGPLFGVDAGFSAAIGMIGLFCGVINCPFASIFLAMEVFDGHYLTLFVITCALSYIFSGYFGLYSSQQIVRSKVGTELIDRNIEE